MRADLASVQLNYFAIPPSMFGTVVQGLANAGCAKDARVIVEKPFGGDLASAPVRAAAPTRSTSSQEQA